MSVIAKSKNMRTVRYGSGAFEEAVKAVRHAAEGGSGTSIVFAGGSAEDVQAALADLARQISFNVHQVKAASLVGERRMQTVGNLREVFDNASEHAALLFFDQADALFDAPDVVEEEGTNALTSVDYLFQRMASYQGIVVLCLQDPDHVAEAQARGVDAVVEF